MAVTNDPTGRRSTCTLCSAEVEEALLLKGLRSTERDPKTGRAFQRVSNGVPVWRTLDRGHACAVCPSAADGQHQPGSIKRTSAR